MAAGVVRFQKKKEIWLGLSSALNSTILLDLRRTSRRVMIIVVSSQSNKLLSFLAQNCIRLESNLFRIRLLDFLIQNIRPVTTPTHSIVTFLLLKILDRHYQYKLTF